MVRAIVLTCLSGCLRFSAHPAANTKPQAVVANEIVAAPREIVLLDASASFDADADPLSFRWDIAASTDALVITEPTTERVTLTMPDRGQRIFVRLVVNDGAVDSDAAIVRIRVNTGPRADAGSFRTGAPPLLLQGSAQDPEADAITAWEWRVDSGPACVGDTTCFDDVHAQVPRFSPPVSGDYVVALRASDGLVFGEWAPASVTVLSPNRAPILALSQTSDVATEGNVFAALTAAASSDPDGDPITVTWTKTTGVTGFPNTLQGLRPDFTAPPFVPSEDNSATYSVVASDGALTSEAQSVTVFTAPGAGFLIVSSGANAADTPLCGTRSLPCRTMQYAMSIVGGTRQLVMTSGAFVDIPADFAQGIVWKPATSLYAGRDPVTFARSTPSDWLISSGCAVGNFGPGIRLGPTVSGVQIDNVAVALTVSCANTHVAVYCNGCGATLNAITANSSSPDGQSLGLYVSNGAVNVNKSTLIGGNGATTRAVLADLNSTVVISDSVLQANATGPSISAVDSSALRSNNSSITAKRSSFRILGSYTGIANNEPSAGVYLKGGSFLGENIDVVQKVDPKFSGFYLETTTALTLINTTLVGAGVSAASGAAISTPGPVGVMNTLVQGFPLGFELRTPASQSSGFYGNVLSAIPTAVTCQGVTGDLGSSSSCNGSGQAWANNTSGNCSFVAAASNDYRLANVSNACVDAGVSSSPVGTAPQHDKELAPRPLGAAPDVGSDELK